MCACARVRVCARATPSAVCEFQSICCCVCSRACARVRVCVWARVRACVSVNWCVGACVRGWGEVAGTCGWMAGCGCAGALRLESELHPSLCVVVPSHACGCGRIEGCARVRDKKGRGWGGARMCTSMCVCVCVCVCTLRFMAERAGRLRCVVRERCAEEWGAGRSCAGGCVSRGMPTRVLACRPLVGGGGGVRGRRGCFGCMRISTPTRTCSAWVRQVKAVTGAM